MDYLEFHKQWHQFGCFNIYQIRCWCPGFNRLNLNNWIKKGLIVKLRKEYYAFADWLKVPDFSEYVANRIYRPSYISLQYALAHYGMIPEGVFEITSVTSLKTARFHNAFGYFSYQTVKNELMFGYKPLSLKDGRSIFFAHPEKALLDLLYLNPFYKTKEDMIELRLDDWFMAEEFNVPRFLEYAEKVHSHSLDRRIATLLKSYDI